MTTHRSGRHRRRRSPVRAAQAALVPVGIASAATLAVAPLATAAPATSGDDTPPCDDGVDVCVDLSEERAWLTDDGRTTRGPMAIGPGSEEDPTPTGTFTVQRKERHHVSRELDAPMPYAVFFDDEGRAFHRGDTDGSSHGCVRLDTADARAVFAALEPGDEVQIVR